MSKGTSVCRLLVLALAFEIGLVCSAFGQGNPGTLRGTVTDPSGAVVTNAAVGIVTPEGKTISAVTNKSGVYEIKNLAPGKYTVTANAQGFSVFVNDDVEIEAAKPTQFNISLEINVEQQKVDVQEHSTQVDTNPANNAGAIVLQGKDLEMLSDDPDELQSDLEALAGPSAGPNGGQFYIDGFTAGQLPPKSSIREVRVNQNPFSAEYDKLGYGRIEILTKPGTDKYHGQISVLGNSSAFNSQNPFISNEPSYYSTQYMGSVGGPITKKSSFFVDFQRRNINELSIINATILNPVCMPGVFSQACADNPGVSYTASVPDPFTRTNVAPRIDYQISKNNTLTARYQFWRETEVNDGIGQFSLQSRGYNSQDTEHTIQISDTQVIGTKAVNETRFQYLRELDSQTPQNTAATVSVAGAFSTGGSATGSSTDAINHYELQNYTSLTEGTHLLKFGARIRGVQVGSTAEQNFNGTYLFPSIEAYANTFMGIGQQASQYSQVSGGIPAGGTSPLPPVATSNTSWIDAGLYVQDDWRVRPNLTLSYGLRFETQNEIHDHSDWAPRVAFAWGIDGHGKTAAKTVLRAGSGIFYDRFQELGLLQAERFNGVNQVSYLVANPTTFTNPPQPPPMLPSVVSPTIYQVDARMHAPYIIQSAVSLERQIAKSANVAVSYLNSRGQRQFLTWNINAPFNSTDPTNPLVRPLHDVYGLSNVYQFTSEGTFKQNQLIVNTNVRVGARFSVFGFYDLNYADANTPGLNTSSSSQGGFQSSPSVASMGSFPSNQYNLNADWGRSSYDIRHRLFLAGSLAGPYAVRLSPFIVVQSGMPYNVTVGQDLNGDSIFNDRPWFASDVSGDCFQLTAACHYTSQTSNSRVPSNYLTGPTRFSVNLRLSKTFGFGREGAGAPGGGPGGPGGHSHGGPGGFGRAMGGPMTLGPTSNRRYNLTLGVVARNVFNRLNLATPVGNIDSPRFGESIALAGGPFSSQSAVRKIELQATFSF